MATTSVTIDYLQASRPWLQLYGRHIKLAQQGNAEEAVQVRKPWLLGRFEGRGEGRQAN